MFLFQFHDTTDHIRNSELLEKTEQEPPNNTNNKPVNPGAQLKPN
jgi:hypothetical protein